MAINEVIRQRRRELGFTQEQVANRLGVSIPAVSKWESGTTCPDVELIPALARLLQTDVNTLLCFEQELSEREVQAIIQEVTAIVMNQGLDGAFLLAEEKMRRYPSDVKLIQQLAVTLQGAMMMFPVEGDLAAAWNEKIMEMYEQVGQSDSMEYAEKANYMMASQAIVEGKYARAQELIERLPKKSGLDGQLLQANLWMNTERVDEAEKVYASKVLTSVNDLQVSLVQLIRIAIQKGETENAAKYVACGENIMKNLGMWRYNSYIFAFEKAVAEQDASATLELVECMLQAATESWEQSECPMMQSMENLEQGIELGAQMKAALIEELRNAPKYEYLRALPEFKEIIKAVY